MLSACGPGDVRRVELRSTTSWSRSRKVSAPSRSATASSNSRRSDALVMGRPPRPATTSWTRGGSPESARRTFCPTIPPAPTAKAFSSTTTRSARARALRTASSGYGRKHLRPTAPIGTPSSRSSSTTSSIVPSTEPSASTTVSASSRGSGAAGRRSAGRTRARTRPRCCGMAASASFCLACMRYLTSVKASGPTIAPIVIGSSGSRTCRGTNGGRYAATCSAVGTSRRS